MYAQSLHGKLALVTGAGSEFGIGFATARRLAALGARVFLTSTTDRCLERRTALLMEGFEADAFPADLLNVDDRRSLFDRVHAQGAGIDILVNNAGMTSVLDPMSDVQLTHEVDIERWSHTLQRNLTLCFAVTAQALPDMLAAQHGRIVNVASTTGVTGAMYGESAYAAAKAGIVGFTRTLAIEYARHGITANAVAPGWIATESQTADEVLEGAASPIGRSGTADEVAHVIAALCVPEAAYVTGQCIVVDGGNSIAEERATR